MRTSKDIQEQLKTLTEQREALRAKMRRAALDNNQDDFDCYAIQLYMNAGKTTALQWALEGTGE